MQPNKTEIERAARIIEPLLPAQEFAATDEGIWEQAQKAGAGIELEAVKLAMRRLVREGTAGATRYGSCSLYYRLNPPAH
ncbi:MAG: hypothetical protein JWO87_232 [Phycisphaerales bacterium]|nr:hypothetical protein [Phycisphaerales bacterium]MDB5298569.1 hypothetical protein [Phycisphaerales bacterium]MDB5305216.1 hypothetical protein [Phycisphaerales bacterium]